MRSDAGSPARRKRRLWPILSGVIPVLAVAVLLGVGWVGSERAIHPATPHYSYSEADYPELHAQAVTLRSRTGIPISASFYAGPRSATIILSHGYGDTRTLMLPYAAFLNRAGFSVLTYDMRARGQSGGDAVTLGALEAQDLLSVVDYAAGRAGVDASRIGALGLSLGGATSVMAAARDPRIRAVVDDSGFSDAPGVIDNSFEHFVGLPKFPFATISTAIASARIGIDIGTVQPVADAGSIAPRPLFIIHCAQDTIAPPLNSERIFAQAREPKSIWRVPTGGHVDGHKVAREEYERRVIGFFEASLQ